MASSLRPSANAASRTFDRVYQRSFHQCQCRCGTPWTTSSSYCLPLISSSIRPSPTRQQQWRRYASQHPKLRQRQREQKNKNGTEVYNQMSHIEAAMNHKSFGLFAQQKLPNKGIHMPTFLLDVVRHQMKIGNTRAALDETTFLRVVEGHLGPLDTTLERELIQLCTYLLLGPSIARASTNWLGVSIIQSLANHGNIDALLFYGNATLHHESRSHGEYLHRSDHRALITKIHNFAAQPLSDFRFKVLAAKLALLSNDEETAFRLLRQSVEAAQAAYTVNDQSTRANYELAECGGRFPTLLTPWLDLSHLHSNRMVRFSNTGQTDRSVQELRLAREAAQLGADVDDATAHYLVAELSQSTNADGNRVYTSSWLYHMSKAAASHHFHAAFRLGEFYLNTGWRYIEDEPPEHIKPTPFDTEPAVASSEGKGLMARLRSILRGLFAPHPALREHLSPVNRVFYSAAVFPQTPQQRWQLGVEWLRLAAEFTYAPADLALARAYLDEKLWAQAATPAAALDLSESRYTINQALDEVGESATDPNNEFHDIEKAFAHVERVFYALFASEQLKRVKNIEASSGKSRTSILDDASIDSEGWANEWLQFPDVRLHWTHQAKQVEKQARDLCDQMEWTIRSPEGTLLYAPGMDMPSICK